MRYFLLIFLSLWSFQTNAQPDPTSTFKFTIKVDTIVFKKGKSNFRLKIITGNNFAFYDIKEFGKSDFKDDTLHFSIDVNFGSELVFDLINKVTNKKMKVAVTGFYPMTFYQFDLKEFYRGEDFNGALYFDIREILDLMKQSEKSKITWKQCDVRRDKNHYIYLKVNDFGLGNPDGLMLYSWRKTQGREFHNYYHDLDVKYFFTASPSSVSRKFIYKSNGRLCGNSDKILAQYEYLPTKRDKKNKLFGHHSVYTFYEDYTFFVETHNPPPEVSLMSEHQVGIGVWEILDGKITLTTPENWFSIYDNAQDIDPEIFHERQFKIKRKKLMQITDSDWVYRLKRTNGKF